MNETARRNSVLALRDLLLDIAAKPKAYVDTPIHHHLQSQGLIAAYSDSGLGIHPCSLNTLKRACSVSAGGFNAFDQLRKAALGAVASERSKPTLAPKSTKRALEDRVKALDISLTLAHEDLALLTFVLQRALRHGRYYAASSKVASLITRCEADQAEIEDMMTLRHTRSGNLKLVRGGRG